MLMEKQRQKSNEKKERKALISEKKDQSDSEVDGEGQNQVGTVVAPLSHCLLLS